MHRPLALLFLALSPVFVACTTEVTPAAGTPAGPTPEEGPGAAVDADGAAGTPDPVTPTDATDAAGVADTTDSATDSATDSTAGLPPSDDPPAPKRAPSFDFAPGGPIPDEALGAYHVAMTCAVGGEDVGTMTIDLWSDGAPITARNFLRLCDEGFYDGLTFHRILRTFMVQGGDPTATGGGNSPYGTLQAEFSDAPERAHGYGVLSMARLGFDENSASCQFFICCDDGPGVWGLDGKYTSFGRITSGVAALEAMADVETSLTPEREKSKPTVPVTITHAEVREGAAPTGEVIARPMPEPELNGEAEKIVIQHVLVSFAGTQTAATRTKEEAATLAAAVLAKAQAGEDFETLVRTHSDDPIREGDDTPGVYQLLNTGVRDPESERAMFNLEQEFRGQLMELQSQVQSGAITQEDYQTQGTALQTAAQARADTLQWAPRTGMVGAFGDVGFSLEVGAIGMAEFDEGTSPFGWHIIKRLE